MWSRVYSVHKRSPGMTDAIATMNPGWIALRRSSMCHLVVIDRRFPRFRETVRSKQSVFAKDDPLPPTGLDLEK